MILRNLVVAIILLNIGLMARAMDEESRRKVMSIEISLPDRAELEKCLCAAGFDDFVVQTKIQMYFNEFTASLAEIVKIVDQCIQDYARSSSLEWITQGERIKIIECILSKAPETYQQWLNLEKAKGPMPAYYGSRQLFVFERSKSPVQARL